MKLEDKQIKDICRFVGGSQPPKSEFIHEPKDGYIRLIQIRDRLNDDFITFIPEDSTNKLCEPDDILIGRYGPPIFQIFRGFKGAYNVAIMKAVPLEGVDKDYLYYFLLQDSVFKYVDSMSSRTAGQTGVELDSLYEYPVKLPSLDNQKKIAGILKSIDCKIENNNRIVKETETMIKMIYDYWFLQYDFPDANGCPYRSTGGKMSHDDQYDREIPTKWSIIHLKDIAFYSNDRINNSEIDKDSYIGTDNLLSDMKGRKDSEYTPTDGQSTHYQDGDILISNIRPYFKKIWFAKGDGGCSSDVLCIRAYNENLREFIYSTLARCDFFDYDTAGSKGSKMPRGDKKHIMDYPIMFNKDVAVEYSNVVRQMLSVIENYYQQNKELSALRDFILPMLMNGQLRIKE